jgi:hypothetical protein
MKALLAWELGAGQGHIQRLKALAHHLANQGIEPILALSRSNPELANLRWKILQAPTVLMKPLDEGKDSQYHLFTDILYSFGFSDDLTLTYHIKAWQNLLLLVKPDFIIVDSAPILTIAAYQKIPTIVIGSGFAIPPPVTEFPNLRSAPIPIASQQRQLQVTELVERVTRIYTPLGQLLNGKRSLLFTIPELDPYRDYRQQPEYVGIHNAPFPDRLGSISGVPWGYLSEDWQHYSLVTELSQLQPEFGELKQVLVGESVAIHHGGITTSIACLLAGIPQIVLPKYQEQGLTGEVLQQLGVARMIPRPTNEKIEIAIQQIPQLFGQAQTQAKHFSHWNYNYLKDLQIWQILNG